MKTKHLRLMQRAYVILFFCFMYLPIAYMVVLSFHQSKGYALFTGFTLKWYTSLLHNESILHALWVSLYLALFSAVIATVLGTAASLGIASMGRKSRLLVTNFFFIYTVISYKNKIGYFFTKIYDVFLFKKESGDFCTKTILTGPVSNQVPG